MTVETSETSTSAPQLPRTLPFWKMQGAGNDFVVAEAADGATSDGRWGAMAIRICDRHFGVGADGLILVMPSTVADRRMRIFNADGSEAEMCGNGVRCFVKYALDRRLVTASDGASSDRMTVETASGVLDTQAVRDAAGDVATVRVSMGRPDLDPAASGAGGAGRGQAGPVLDFPIEAAGAPRPVTIVSMGNPHAVTFIDAAPPGFPIEVVGPALEHHELFANRTNAEFVQVVDRQHIAMRVWERGVGETLACGSGACAAVVAARLHGRVDDEVSVSLPGGTLTIEWDGEGEVTLSGPAARVFEAVWEVGTGGEPGATGKGTSR